MVASLAAAGTPCHRAAGLLQWGSMKRWQVEFDGASAGHVYADTLDAARRAAQAAYTRVHADRESPRGLVRIVGDPTEVESEVVEAGRVVSEVYEGLRLLPGMEMPAEKLRNVVLLLETAAARAGARAQVAAKKGAGGDTELREALAAVLEARTLPTELKAALEGQVEWVGLNTGEAQRHEVELKLFQTLWEAGLIDPRFVTPAPCALYRASAYLARRLTAARVLRLERFDGARNVDDLRAALKSLGLGKEAVVMTWAFVPPTSGPDPIEVLRPLTFVGDTTLQPALVMRGVPCPDADVVALDRTLFDVFTRLRAWTEGPGRLAEPHLKDVQQQLLPRTDKRVSEVRQQMVKATQEKTVVLPPDTARRDLVKFVIDQVYRIEDALAFLPDRGLRDAFAELVFKDVVFRGAGAYLSKHFGINIDTDIVEGADTQELAGRYKAEPGGPKPRAKTTRIHSVVVPCYTQDGAAIRPASVRAGDF